MLYSHPKVRTQKKHEGNYMCYQVPCTYIHGKHAQTFLHTDQLICNKRQIVKCSKDVYIYDIHISPALIYPSRLSQSTGWAPCVTEQRPPSYLSCPWQCIYVNATFSIHPTFSFLCCVHSLPLCLHSSPVNRFNSPIFLDSIYTC